MDPLKLKYELQENDIVNTLVDVNKIRKISQQQLNDIFSFSPNYLPLFVEKVNEFLEKILHIVRVVKLSTKCEDLKYAQKHPEEDQLVQEYFAKDKLHTDKFSDDIVDLGCMYDAIGKFCISTEKFFKELKPTPGNNKEELYDNILETIDEDMAEHEADRVDTDRYAYRFFKKLLEKNKSCLPHGISVADINGFIKLYVYDADVGTA